MKAYIAVDSYYGCTRAVANAVAEELRVLGLETTVVFLKSKPWPVAEGDILFIGSPTRWGNMTRRAKKFVTKLDAEAWKGKPVFTFDTVAQAPTDPMRQAKAQRWTAHGAAHKLKEMLEAKGIGVRPEMLRADVIGLKGPLAPDALDKVKVFTRDLKF
ncbi:MAG: flavodoxin domain-containing protein [Methanomassiliicoccales archaeon]